MKEKLKELVGKEVSFFHTISSWVHIGFDGNILEVDNGQNIWRMIHNGNVVASTRDLFIYHGDIDDSGYGVIDELSVENIETDDYDEYNEEVYERLYNHRGIKTEKCNELIKGIKVIDIRINEPNDFEIIFSNGTIFQVFSMASNESYSGITFK